MQEYSLRIRRLKKNKEENMIDDKEKECASSWLGLLAITLVCIVIASAIFFGFKDPRRRIKHFKGIPGKGTAGVNFGVGGVDVYRHTDEMLVF